jgi:hypothetical protein
MGRALDTLLFSASHALRTGCVNGALMPARFCVGSSRKLIGTGADRLPTNCDTTRLAQQRNDFLLSEVRPTERQPHSRTHRTSPESPGRPELWASSYSTHRTRPASTWVLVPGTTQTGRHGKLKACW